MQSRQYSAGLILIILSHQLSFSFFSLFQWQSIFSCNLVNWALILLVWTIYLYSWVLGSGLEECSRVFGDSVCGFVHSVMLLKHSWQKQLFELSVTGTPDFCHLWCLSTIVRILYEYYLWVLFQAYFERKVGFRFFSWQYHGITCFHYQLQIENSYAGTSCGYWWCIRSIALKSRMRA